MASLNDKYRAGNAFYFEGADGKRITTDLAGRDFVGDDVSEVEGVRFSDAEGNEYRVPTWGIEEFAKNNITEGRQVRPMQRYTLEGNSRGGADDVWISGYDQARREELEARGWKSANAAEPGIMDTIFSGGLSASDWRAPKNRGEDVSAATVAGDVAYNAENAVRGIGGAVVSAGTGVVKTIGDLLTSGGAFVADALGAAGTAAELRNAKRTIDDMSGKVLDWSADNILGEAFYNQGDGTRDMVKGGLKAADEVGGLYGLGKVVGAVAGGMAATAGRTATVADQSVAMATMMGAQGFEDTLSAAEQAGKPIDSRTLIAGAINGGVAAAVAPLYGKLAGLIGKEEALRLVQKSYGKMLGAAAVDVLEGAVLGGVQGAAGEVADMVQGGEASMTDRAKRVMTSALVGGALVAGTKVPGALGGWVRQNRVSYARAAVVQGESALAAHRAGLPVERVRNSTEDVRAVTINGEVIFNDGTVYVPARVAPDGRRTSEAKIVINDGTVLDPSGKVVGVRATKLGYANEVLGEAATPAEAVYRQVDPDAPWKFRITDPVTGEVTDNQALAGLETPESVKSWMAAKQSGQPAPELDADGVAYMALWQQAHSVQPEIARAAQVALEQVATGKMGYRQAAEVVDNAITGTIGGNASIYGALKRGGAVPSDVAGGSAAERAAQPVRADLPQLGEIPEAPRTGGAIDRGKVTAAETVVGYVEDGTMRPSEVDATRIAPTEQPTVPGNVPVVLAKDGVLTPIVGGDKIVEALDQGAKTVNAVVVSSEDGWDEKGAKAIAYVQALKDGGMTPAETVKAIAELGLDSEEVAQLAKDESAAGLADVALRVAPEALPMVSDENLPTVSALTQALNVRTMGFGWDDAQVKLLESMPDGAEADVAEVAGTIAVNAPELEGDAVWQIAEWAAAHADRADVNDALNNGKRGVEELREMMGRDRAGTTAVEMPDGNFKTVNEVEAEAPKAAPIVTQQRLDLPPPALKLEPVAETAGEFHCARFPDVKVSVTSEGISVTGLDLPTMLDGRNRGDMGELLNEIAAMASRAGKTVDVGDAAIAAVADELVQNFEDESRARAMTVRAKAAGNVLMKSGLASGIVTNQRQFDRALSQFPEGVRMVKDGQTWGFYNPNDGKVYLNPSVNGTKIFLNTTIHEFAHPALVATRKANPELYARGMDLIVDTDYYKMVAEYPDYKGMSEQSKREEALVRLLSERLEDIRAKVPAKIYKEIEEFVSQFWSRFGDACGISDLTPAMVQSMTVEDVADAIGAEMMSGREFGARAAGASDTTSISRRTGTATAGRGGSAAAASADRGTSMPQGPSTGQPAPEGKEGISGIDARGNYTKKTVVPASDVMLNRATQPIIDAKIGKWEVSGEAKKLGWTTELVGKVQEKFSAVMDKLFTTMKRHKEFVDFQKVMPKTMIDFRDGKEKPLQTWTRQNDEYFRDVSGDMLCINNDGVQDLENWAINSGFMKKLGLWDVNSSMRLWNALRDSGCVVPCKGCYDAQKRQANAPSMAQKFIREIDAELAEFKKNPAKYRRDVAAGKGLTGPVGKVKIEIAEGRVTEKNKPDWTQFQTSSQWEKLVEQFPGVARAWESEGQAKPKDQWGPTPYTGTTMQSEYTIFTKPGKREKSFRVRELEYGIVRRNSHSEFRPVLVYDEAQWIQDMALKHARGFKYTADLWDPAIFGWTGMKFNMSGKPECVPGGVAAGLDAKGDYAWSKESIGGREKGDGKKGIEAAKALRNKDCSISVQAWSWPHLIKLLADVPTPKNKKGWVGSIIPLHWSNASKEQLAAQEMIDTVDFTPIQNVRFGEGWKDVDGDPVAPGKKVSFVASNTFTGPDGRTLKRADMGQFDYNAIKERIAEDARKAGDKEREKHAYIYAAEEVKRRLDEYGLVSKFDERMSDKEFLEYCKIAKVDPKNPAYGWKKGKGWSIADGLAYYSVLCDYGETNAIDDTYSPHRPILEEYGYKFDAPESFYKNADKAMAAYTARRKGETSVYDEVKARWIKAEVEAGNLDAETAREYLAPLSVVVPGKMKGAPLMARGGSRVRSVFVAGRARVADDAGMGELTPGAIAASRELSRQGAAPLSMYGQIHRLALPVSEMEWLRKRLTGDARPAVVGNGRGTSGGRLAIEADVFGTVDKTDMASEKARLVAHGFFRNEDPVWCAGQLPSGIRAERARSEDQLARQLLRLGERRANGTAEGGQAAARGVYANEVATIIMDMPGVAPSSVLGRVQTIGRGVRTAVETAIRAQGVAAADVEARMRDQAGTFLDWAYADGGIAAANGTRTPRAQALTVSQLTSEMFGKFLVMPQEVERQAPEWYQSIMSTIANTPTLADAWRELTVRGMTDQSHGAVIDAIRRSQTRDHEQALASLKAEGSRPIAAGGILTRAKEKVVIAMHDTLGAVEIRITERARQYVAARKRLMKTMTPAQRAVVQGEIDRFMNVTRTNLERLDLARTAWERGGWNEGRRYPMLVTMALNQATERYGLRIEDISLYATLQRIVETQGRAGSFGVSARQAQLGLGDLSRRLGAEKWRRLQETDSRIHAIIESEVLDNPDLREMLGDGLVNYFKGQVHYVTTRRVFSPEELDQIEQQRARMRTLGIAGGDDVISQMYDYAGKIGAEGEVGEGNWTARLKGSMSASQEALSATLAKQMAMMNAARRNHYVVAMRNALLAAGVEGVRDLPRRGDGAGWPENRRYGRINYMLDGEKRVLVVPRIIADGMKLDTNGVGLITKVNGWCRALYIDYNVAYWNQNINRNNGSIEKNMPGMREPYLETAARMLAPGVHRIVALAAEHLIRHIPERVSLPLRIILGRNTPYFFIPQAKRLTDFLQDPTAWQKRLWAAEDAGDVGKVTQMQDDMLVALEMLKGNMFVPSHHAYSAGETNGFLNDVLEGKALKLAVAVAEEEARRSGVGKFVRAVNVFRRNQAQQEWEDVFAKTKAYLHDRMMFGTVRTPQQSGQIVKKNVSIAEGERHGEMKGVIQKFFAQFFNMCEKGNVRHWKAIKDRPGETLAKDALVWGGRFIGALFATGVIYKLFREKYGDEKKAREAVGPVYDYAKFAAAAAKNVSGYTKQNTEWLPLWMSPDGYATVALSSPLNDEDKLIVPTADAAAQTIAYMAGVGTKPDWSGALVNSTVKAVTPDLQASTPFMNLGKTLLATFTDYNPQDLFRGAPMFPEDLHKNKFASAEDLEEFGIAASMRLWNDFGGRAVWQAPVNGVDNGRGAAPETLEQVLRNIPVLSPAIARFIKIQVGTPEKHAGVVVEKRDEARRAVRLCAKRLLAMTSGAQGIHETDPKAYEEKIAGWVKVYGLNSWEEMTLRKQYLNGWLQRSCRDAYDQRALSKLLIEARKQGLDENDVWIGLGEQ